MKVTLIDYTGAGTLDPASYAARLLVYTKSTRLTQGEDTRKAIDAMTWAEIVEQLDYIAKTIRSSWEFIDYTFEISGVSRAFTHQFVRTRTGSYAQESQRTVSKEGGFDSIMPDAFRGKWKAERLWEDGMEMIGGLYDDLCGEGYSPQDARGVLPTNVSTNIIAKFNLRTMADLIPKRESTRAQGEYTKVARAMADAMLKVHPWIDAFLWPERTATPAVDKILRDLVGNACPAEKPAINAALKEVEALKKVWG